MKLIKRLESRGDTIVEVLIAMAVIGLVLAGAYVTTQQSVIATQDAQERSEALKLLEGQIENLREVGAANPSSLAPPPSNNFCMSSTSIALITDHAVSATLPSFTSDGFSTTDYPAGCIGVGVNGLYNIAIEYDSASGVYTLTNRWDKVGGGKDQVGLVYRIN